MADRLLGTRSVSEIGDSNSTGDMDGDEELHAAATVGGAGDDEEDDKPVYPKFYPIRKSYAQAIDNIEMDDLDSSGNGERHVVLVEPRRESTFSKVTGTSEVSSDSAHTSSSSVSLLARFKSSHSKSNNNAAKQSPSMKSENPSRTNTQVSLLVPKKKRARPSQADSGFEGAFDSEFWAKVQEKKDLDGLLPKLALREARLDRIIAQKGGSSELAVLEILEKAHSQGEACQLMDGLIARGIDLGCRDEPYLHVAAERNFVYAARTLMDNDVSAEMIDEENRLPVIIALNAGHDEMAAVILRKMPKKSVKMLFEPSQEENSQYFNYQDLVVGGTMPMTCRAVLDACLSPTDEPDEYRFYYRILESDGNGLAPSDPGFNANDKTVFHRVLEAKDKELQRHNVVRMLIYNKWVEYGERMAFINLILYLVFVVIVTFALVSAGRQADPRIYISPENYVRAVLEVLSLLAVLFNFYDELKEFKRGKLAYLTDGQNYLQVGSMLLILTIIPLRWVDVYAQWHVACFAYIFMCLRILQLISVTRVVGIYLQILTRILYKDITRFVIIFGIFLLTYTGSLFLALRSEPINGLEHNSTSDPADFTELSIGHFTSNYGYIMLSGLKTMIEQESSVDYLNDPPDPSFSWLAVIINMLFLFFVLVVLLNILIAQLSDTYADVKADAQRELEQNWANSLRNFEQGTSPLRHFRFRNYNDYEDVEHPGKRLLNWEEPKNADEDEEEMRRRRQMEQDIEKQGQQIVALKAQMRATLELLHENRKVPPKLDENINQLGLVQVPAALTDIVGRSETVLRGDVTQCQEQQRSLITDLSTAAEQHTQSINQSLVDQTDTTRTLVRTSFEGTDANIRTVQETLARQIPEQVDQTVSAAHAATLSSVTAQISEAQGQVVNVGTIVKSTEAALLETVSSTSLQAAEQRRTHNEEIRAAIDAQGQVTLSSVTAQISEAQGQVVNVGTVVKSTEAALLETVSSTSLQAAEQRRTHNEEIRAAIDASEKRMMELLSKSLADTTKQMHRDIVHELDEGMTTRHSALTGQLADQVETFIAQISRLVTETAPSQPLG